MWSGLKDVNKLLKLVPCNTKLVVQKQKMFKDAIRAAKEKLATLKTAAQQANEQLVNGEITRQQYDALQCETAETEQNLKALHDQAVTTNATLAKIDEAGAKLQNIGSSLENAGKKKDPANMDGNTKIHLENQDTAEARVQKYIPAFSMPIFERRRRSRLILSTLKDGGIVCTGWVQRCIIDKASVLQRLPAERLPGKDGPKGV